MEDFPASTGPSGRDEPAETLDDIQLGAACPGCGARIALSSLDPSVRCRHCQTSHLVTWRGAVTTIALRKRVSGAEDAASVAGVAAGAGVHHTPFLAPYWLLGLRLHEAVVGHGPGGKLVAQAWSAPLHLSRPAFPEEIRLPIAGRLPDLLEVDFPSPGGPAVPQLPLAGSTPLDRDVERATAVRLVPDIQAVVRDARVARGPVHLLLRPFHLIETVGGDGGAFLVDGSARSIVATLSADEARRLRDSVVARAIQVSSQIAFRPMRCPICASRLALSERGEIRFCPGCRRALEVVGERLAPVSYRAESRTGEHRLLLPFWRFRFRLEDPRDGRELRAVDAVAEAAGGTRAASSPSFPCLDVPAFRTEGKRRQRPGLSRLPAIGELPSDLLVEGPVRGEAGFPEPARFVAVSSSSGALIARHALLLSVPPDVVARAAPRRLEELIFKAPLELDPPTLVLRSLRPDALSP